MNDLFTYLKWRGDIPFTQVPVTPVDALILSELSYLGLSGIVSPSVSDPISLGDAAKAFLALPTEAQVCRTRQDVKLLKACAATERFGSVGLTFFRDLFIPEEETQFAALSFLLEDGSAFLAFRGTDYSLVGWKEDFNMSFADTIPAQREALRYTQEFSADWSGPLYLGGHSKGGNVAVYAAAKVDASVQSRILGVYNHDGPGFTDILMGDPGYIAMVPKIHTYIPQSSIIGMLLEHEEPYTVVKSSLVGILQHECYSWAVLGGDFVHVDEITEHSRFIDRTLKQYLADMSKEERYDFVDTVFSLLGSGGADKLFDLLHPRQIAALLKTLGSDEKKRSFLMEKAAELLHTAWSVKQNAEND